MMFSNGDDRGFIWMYVGQLTKRFAMESLANGVTKVVHLLASSVQHFFHGIETRLDWLPAEAQTGLGNLSDTWSLHCWGVGESKKVAVTIGYIYFSMSSISQRNDCQLKR